MSKLQDLAIMDIAVFGAGYPESRRGNVCVAPNFHEKQVERKKFHFCFLFRLEMVYFYAPMGLVSMLAFGE